MEPPIGARATVLSFCAVGFWRFVRGLLVYGGTFGVVCFDEVKIFSRVVDKVCFSEVQFALCTGWLCCGVDVVESALLPPPRRIGCACGRLVGPWKERFWLESLFQNTIPNVTVLPGTLVVGTYYGLSRTDGMRSRLPSDCAYTDAVSPSYQDCSLNWQTTIG